MVEVTVRRNFAPLFALWSPTPRAPLDTARGLNEWPRLPPASCRSSDARPLVPSAWCIAPLGVQDPWISAPGRTFTCLRLSRSRARVSPRKCAASTQTLADRCCRDDGHRSQAAPSPSCRVAVELTSEAPVQAAPDASSVRFRHTRTDRFSGSYTFV